MNLNTKHQDGEQRRSFRPIGCAPKKKELNKKREEIKKGDQKEQQKKIDQQKYLLFATFRMIVFGKKRKRLKKGIEKTKDETKKCIFQKVVKREKKETTKKNKKNDRKMKTLQVSSFK